MGEKRVEKEINSNYSDEKTNEETERTDTDGKLKKKYNDRCGCRDVKSSQSRRYMNILNRNTSTGRSKLEGEKRAGY